MKILRTLLATAFLLIGLPGCLQSENVIKLKADGSGTIERSELESAIAAVASKDGDDGKGGSSAKQHHDASTREGSGTTGGDEPHSVQHVLDAAFDGRAEGEGISFDEFVDLLGGHLIS